MSEKPSKTSAKTLLLLKAEMDRFVDEAGGISTHAEFEMDIHLRDDRRNLRRIWSRLRTVRRRKAGAFEGYFLDDDAVSTRKCAEIAYACRQQMHQVAALRQIVRIRL